MHLEQGSSRVLSSWSILSLIRLSSTTSFPSKAIWKSSARKNFKDYCWNAFLNKSPSWSTTFSFTVLLWNLLVFLFLLILYQWLPPVSLQTLILGGDQDLSWRKINFFLEISTLGNCFVNMGRMYQLIFENKASTTSNFIEKSRIILLRQCINRRKHGGVQ